MNDEKIRKIRAERLKKLLKDNNMKQTDLCKHEKTDGSGNTTFKESDISDWINGKRILSEKKAQQLIDEFFPDVRLSWLLGYDDFATMNDRIVHSIDLKNVQADSMWATINNSLSTYGMELKFVHAAHICPDAISRIKYGKKGLCWYEITKDDECIKKLSVQELIEIERSIQNFANYTFFSILKV